MVLKDMLQEFFPLFLQIATKLGNILDYDSNNNNSLELLFCIAMDSGVDWEQKIWVNNLVTNNKKSIFINYLNLLIRGCFCLDIIQ